MGRHTAIATGCLLSLTLLHGAEAGSDRITEASVIALQNWISAVNAHAPGRPDEAARNIAALSYDTRRDLNAGLGLFFSGIRSEKVAVDGYGKRIVEIGRLLAQRPGIDVFLKRAIVLHSDAAAYGDTYPVPSTASSKAGPQAREKGLEFDPHGGMPMNVRDRGKTPPLLTDSRIVLDKDGQVVGETAASWNWPFARSLLDELLTIVPFSGFCRGGGCVGDGAPITAADPFVGAWYHATASYMFASGLYGDATAHLQAAGDVLPNDARVLFDRACYAEILGLPMHQVLVSDTDRFIRRGSGAPVGPRSRGDLGIPLMGKTNAVAEGLFRRALEADPSYVEARVRLARLLEVRKRHDEAAAELKTALGANPTGVVGFYAHLFAGRTAQSLGKLDDAAHHYAEASALFPNAQSALLASSQVALLASDVSATLAPVSHLGAGSAGFMADPWWQYHLAAGRDADALLRDVWAQVR